METTILLSKVLGLFIMITGFIVLIRKEFFIPLISVFIKNHFLRVIVSVIELIAGLFLVMSHNNFTTLPAMIISTLGWLAIVESIFYLMAPDKMLQNLLSNFKNLTLNTVCGVLSIVIGFYLTGSGFGWF